METLYEWCAVLAGTLLIGQFLLSLLGVGHDHDGFDHGSLPDGSGLDHEIDLDADHDMDLDHDADADHGSGMWFLGLLSFRSVVAAVAIFGLTGLAAQKEYEPALALSIASAAGLSVLFLVAWLLKTFYSFANDGTVRIEDALGASGQVYIRIPQERSGEGRVTVSVANRTMEYQAVTAGEELPTGTPIIVVDIVDRRLVAVAAAE